MQSWLFFPYAEIRECSQTPERYAKPLKAYFAGEPVAFDFPFDFVGTPFQQTVWQALTEVPYGTTVSYSELAARIQRPSAVRAVANAVGRNPMMIIVLAIVSWEKWSIDWLSGRFADQAEIITAGRDSFQGLSAFFLQKFTRSSSRI